MIITNHLNASQSAQVADLEALCKQYEPLQGSIFLSNELNFDTELPCFYLLYNPNDDRELISFLSVFAPLQTEAEIYAYTAPDWRRQGCFNALLEAALHTLQEYGIESILFVHEPASSSASAVLDTLDTVYQYSEYLLSMSGAQAAAQSMPSADHLALLPAKEKEQSALAAVHALAFEESSEVSTQFLANVFASSASHVRKLINKENGELIGICCYTTGKSDISIFSVAVQPQQHRKGHASFMLKALLAELASDYPQHTVTLEVNSQNIPAFSLYRKLGFTITTQFDYSYADSIELLELF